MNDPNEGTTGGHSIHVSVALKGSLAGRFPGGRTELEVAEGVTVGGLVDALDLPQSSYIFVVNGAMADRVARLGDGDHVQIHPPMAGG